MRVDYSTQGHNLSFSLRFKDLKRLTLGCLKRAKAILWIIRRGGDDQIPHPDQMSDLDTKRENVNYRLHVSLERFMSCVRKHVRSVCEFTFTTTHYRMLSKMSFSRSQAR
ncbi:hypothetical protein CEXT_189091 [Caerostris extrusa]|uniref:Uncharacterized protein n=1 Tax=Caerostris extrusa TaxID=172846 RepID=A0AAV4P4A8_CAEEX|nr:hypothetical protein CEXT_189091 [Caerostris extrusa]